MPSSGAFFVMPRLFPYCNFPDSTIFPTDPRARDLNTMKLSHVGFLAFLLVEVVVGKMVIGKKLGTLSALFG